MAAIAGGVAWVVKGTAILVTGDQPSVAFGVGPPLFALGLLGFYLGLGGADARAKVGAGAATFAIGLMVAFGIADAVAPSLASRGEKFTVLSAVQLAAALCLLAASCSSGSPVGEHGGVIGPPCRSGWGSSWFPACWPAELSPR